MIFLCSSRNLWWQPVLTRSMQTHSMSPTSMSQCPDSRARSTPALVKTTGWPIVALQIVMSGFICRSAVVCFRSVPGIGAGCHIPPLTYSFQSSLYRTGPSPGPGPAHKRPDPCAAAGLADEHRQAEIVVLPALLDGEGRMDQYPDGIHGRHVAITARHRFIIHVSSTTPRSPTAVTRTTMASSCLFMLCPVLHVFSCFAPSQVYPLCCLTGQLSGLLLSRQSAT